VKYNLSKKRWLKYGKAAAAALMLLSLGACAMIPPEEVLPPAPLVRKTPGHEYATARAEYTDMVLQTEVICTYVPVQSETLSYTIDGEFFGGVFVHSGQQVEKGQLLARLDVSEWEAQLKKSEQSMRTLNVRMAALEENRKLALEREQILGKSRTSAQTKEAIADINKEYDRRKQTLQDEMQIECMRQEEYQKKISERELRAGIDGTVTYVRRSAEGAKSKAGEKIVTVADTRMSLFRAQTQYASHFEAGSEQTIRCGQDSYEAVVCTAQELGLSEAQALGNRDETVYFRLRNPEYDLKDGTKGTLTLILDTRAQALTVPAQAVSRINGQTVVYYPDEDGMKAYKAVETGLEAGGRVEILSGLAEGERVIIE